MFTRLLPPFTQPCTEQGVNNVEIFPYGGHKSCTLCKYHYIQEDTSTRL